MIKLLLVEDDPCVSYVYREALEAAGFSTDVATTPTGAVAKLEQDAPAAVLLDLMLGDQSGIDVLEFVRAQSSLRRVPVVILSQAYMSELMQAAWRKGADRCLDKNTTTPRRVVEEICSAMFARHEASLMPAPSGTSDFAAGRRNTRAGIRRRARSLVVRPEDSPAPLQDPRSAQSHGPETDPKES